ncbi:MAG: 3-hydroxyacyl-CoA dehydrogenase NAD-binding domain-containing protein [Alcaligenaceae bacterium]|nr:3-hydroxyacyl-CoA dehydrogenase NAD-binding domain-containing protein [Alcaligenaceae bacterium]
MTQQFKHFSLKEEAQVFWLYIDRADSEVNALSAELMAEFHQVLDYLEQNKAKGLIITSAKETGFVVGADINEFSDLATAEQVKAMVARGWDLFNRLEAVSYPTLALINGHCLGGGLELALACRYRMVIEESDARLGLPEVMLGIFPGWGGIKRLPEQVGAIDAMDMMLTGRRINARRAYAMALIDAVIPQRVSEAAARDLLLSGRPARQVTGWKKWLNHGPLKSVVASRVNKQLSQKDPYQHYLAPRAILELWKENNGNALKNEVLLQNILGSDTASNLLRVYHLQERLKTEGRPENYQKMATVHVVGAGVMGGDIAVWCALQGLQVTLQDQNMEAIAAVIGRAAKLFKRRLRDPLLIRAALDRLIPDPHGHGVARADLVIEAISENLEAKRGLYAQLETIMRPDALLATNTSSLALELLSEKLAQPERLVGIHFFNPVALMPLVEVIYKDNPTAEHQAAIDKARGFVGQINKLPLVVKSVPGFLVNAALTPYMLEAIALVDQGYAPVAIDKAMEAYGMPVGPIELVDMVGLDVALAVGQELVSDVTTPRCLEEKIQANKLGRKSGEGFYQWKAGKAVKPKGEKMSAELAQKLADSLAAAAKRQTDQGVVADADLADAGMIFGTGYAPFTGGPLFKRGMTTSQIKS